MLWFKQKSGYQKRKEAHSKAVIKKLEKVQLLKAERDLIKIQNEIFQIKNQSEIDRGEAEISKISTKTDYLDEIEELRERLVAGKEDDKLMQLLNSPVGQMLAQKFLGVKLNLDTPQSREIAGNILMQKAEENPELVAKGMKKAREMGLIGKK